MAVVMMRAPAGASNGWSGFAKTILIPLFIALLLYTTIFHAIIPLYRRYKSHISRYSSYTPLYSTLAFQTTQQFFDPLIIQPSRSLWDRLNRSVRMTLWRWAVPGVQHVDLDHGRHQGSSLDETHDYGEEMDSPALPDDIYVYDADDQTATPHHNDIPVEDDPNLLDDHTAGNMIGFDLRSSSGDGRLFSLGRRRAESRTNTNRPGTQHRLIGGTAGGSRCVPVQGDFDSDMRLSRDLEQGFRDDSDSDTEVDANVNRGDDVVVLGPGIGRR